MEQVSFIVDVIKFAIEWLGFGKQKRWGRELLGAEAVCIVSSSLCAWSEYRKGQTLLKDHKKHPELVESPLTLNDHIYFEWMNGFKIVKVLILLKLHNRR